MTRHLDCRYYFGYNQSATAGGGPAGDYLGTLTQMDAQIGALRTLLAARGARDDTLVWFTADNGPHAGNAGEVGQLADVRTATNGLRQCKASLFEVRHDASHKGLVFFHN